MFHPNGLKLIISLTITLFAVLICHAELSDQNMIIQVTVPDEPYPGTKICVIADNVRHEKDRNIFAELYRTTKKVGMCSSAKIEHDNDASEVIIIAIYGKSIERKVFRVLKNSNGEWITTGYGHVEKFDHPEGFPQYFYQKSILEEIKQWYNAHVPKEKQKYR